MERTVVLSKKFYCYALLLVLVGTGCATPSKTMINPQSMHQVNCSSFGIGLGAAIAAAQQSNCVNTFTVKGYMDIAEFEKTEPQKVTKIQADGKPVAGKPALTLNTKWVYKAADSDITSTVAVNRKDSYEGSPVYVFSFKNSKDGRDSEEYLAENLDTVAAFSQGNKHLWDPPQKNYDWPLEVGKAWMAVGTVTNDKGSVNTLMNLEVKDYGKVTVPAGTYETFYLLAKNDKGMRVYELWYAPEIKNFVKKTTYYGDATVTLELQEYVDGK